MAKEKEFIPSECKERKEGEELLPPSFSGSLKVEVPNFMKRMEYVKQCNFKTVDKGGGQMEIAAGMDNIDSIIQMAKIAEKHVKSVSLKHIESGEEYKSWGDLLEDPACDSMISEISGYIMNGVSAGKS